MASILDRYLNTDKYQGEMRDLVNCQVINDKTQSGLFLKDTALARIGRELLKISRKLKNTLIRTIQVIKLLVSSLKHHG